MEKHAVGVNQIIKKLRILIILINKGVIGWKENDLLEFQKMKEP